MHSLVDSDRLRVAVVSEPGLDGVFRHVEGLTRFLLAKGQAVDLVYSSVRGSERLQSWFHREMLRRWLGA